MLAYRTNAPPLEPFHASVPSGVCAYRCHIWPDYAIEHNGREVRFGKVMGRFVARVATARGGPVFEDELIEAIWGDREDGGPLGARDTLKQHAHRLRLAIEPIGLTLAHEWGGGYWIEAR